MECVPLGLLALGLAFLDLFEDFLALVDEALTVEREQAEGGRLFEESFGVAEELVGLGVIVDLDVVGDALDEAEGEDALLQITGALAMPEVGGILGDELAFVLGGRSELSGRS